LQSFTARHLHARQHVLSHLFHALNLDFLRHAETEGDKTVWKELIKKTENVHYSLHALSEIHLQIN
jgi:hypothetical protein